MYAAFTGQPLEKVQQYTERDRFLSVSEVNAASLEYILCGDVAQLVISVSFPNISS